MFQSCVCVCVCPSPLQKEVLPVNFDARPIGACSRRAVLGSNLQQAKCHFSRGTLEAFPRRLVGIVALRRIPALPWGHGWMSQQPVEVLPFPRHGNGQHDRRCKCRTPSLRFVASTLRGGEKWKGFVGQRPRCQGRRGHPTTRAQSLVSSLVGLSSSRLTSFSRAQGALSPGLSGGAGTEPWLRCRDQRRGWDGPSGGAVAGG